MENSNTLPKIEVGDTVIFRTDLEDGKKYGRLPYMKSMDEDVKNQSLVFELEGSCFRTEECGYWFTLEMVKEVIKPSKEVIKPTKERVYTEEEMRKAIEMAAISRE